MYGVNKLNLPGFFMCKNELLAEDSMLYNYCARRAAKYNRMVDWVKNDRKSYGLAWSHGWQKKIAKEFGWELYQQPGSPNWTYESCLDRAGQYNSATEWAKSKDHPSYLAACRKGWQRQIGKALGWSFQNSGQRVTRSYTDCLENAKFYTYLKEWAKNDKAVYQYAKTRGWHHKIAKELGWVVLPRESWSYEKCLASAERYTT